MKATMAMTLMMANQYSNSPKLPTRMTLIAIKTDRDSNNPNPLRNCWEPDGKVNCDGRDLGADGNDLNEGVGSANREA